MQERSLQYTTIDGRLHAVHMRDVRARRLAALLPSHELVLVGGSSVVGALSRGDVDLHLRVAPKDFEESVAALRTIYRVVHPEIWQPSLATFEDAIGDVDVGIAVTPVGSDHDHRFSSSWARLTESRALLGRYNAMKLGSTPGEYERSKARFFDELHTTESDRS